MSNNLRTRNGMPLNFVNGLKVRGIDIESLIPGIEGIPEAGSKYQFAGNGSNKAFTLPVTPYNKDAVDVYVKQLYVHPDDYTLVGDTVTLTEAPPAVVIGETYNVVIKVSLTTLNGYVNANRVSFEGENLDDILEKGKPLANYYALRAYTGAATQVRITDPGIAGFFYYDSTDTSSADNGGTIVVSNNGKRWKRLFDGAINVKWFGAKGDWNGTTGTDDTAAIQSVYDYLKLQAPINRRGAGKIYVPRGRYLCNGTVTMSSALTVIWEGDGPEASQIIRTVDTGNLFNIATYIYVEFANLGIYHTTANDRTGWTTSCFRLSGVGGGRELCLRRITTNNFNRVVSFEGNGGNEDTNYFQGCTFNDFKTFLFVYNSQSVVNKATQCTWYGNVDRVFDVAGFGYTHIDTCNAVQSGTFIYIAPWSTSNPTAHYLVTNAKFEWLNPSKTSSLGTTKILEMANSAIATAYIKFVNCGIAGGTPDSTVYQWDLQGGNYTVEVNGGQWGDTKIQTRARTVQGDHNFWWVKFANCKTAPSTAINRIAGATGSHHVPVAFQSCSGVADILMRGPGGTYGGDFVGNGKIAGITLDRNRNTKNANGYLVTAANTFTHSFPSYGQLVLVEKIRVVATGAAGWAGAEIKAFADAGLTIQIGTTITPAGGTWSSPTAYAYDITVPANTFTSDGIYVTVKNTNASGGVSGLVYVDTLSV